MGEVVFQAEEWLFVYIPDSRLLALPQRNLNPQHLKNRRPKQIKTFVPTDIQNSQQIKIDKTESLNNRTSRALGS